MIDEEEWDKAILQRIDDLIRALPLIAFLAFMSVFLFWLWDTVF